ncbi:MAG: phospholipase D family protein [Gammaproteobacteria bacterium]|jgi:putative cardiolipin synthase
MKLFIVFSVLIVTSCASLPDVTDKPVSFAYQDTENTQLGRAIQSLTKSQRSETGLLPLQGGVDAFTARYVLSNAAERSIDAQYYIWHDDLTGKLLVHALLEAANRGIRVRLLLDDINMAGKDNILATLDAHPNIEVRLFNPFANRNFRAMDIITDFRRINRRMHNKSFTIDNQVTIVGGRNIGDEYFDANPAADVQDFDLLAIGSVVHAVSQEFDSYWNSKFSVPVDALVTGSDEQAIEPIKKSLDNHVAQASNTVYIDAVKKSRLLNNITAKKLTFFWDEAEVFYDDPQKIDRDKEDDSTHLRSKLDPLLADTQQEIIIISPYFIPGEKGVNRIKEAKDRGIDFRILTNSLSSTDVPLVYSSYSPYRIPLLELGVDLYEMKPTYRSRKKAKLMDVSSRASLHSKVYIFDRKHIFVGSYNLDPRSTSINTEMGIFIKDTEIATHFAKWWDKSITQLAYKLELDNTGKDFGDNELVWLDLAAETAKRYDDEPNAGTWMKLKNDFLSIFPLEGQL